ncbi:AGE family epimerase/isomerase [Halosimplex amylolyticum]|uniref:AGE family epimerase/isomerase n=1 Tax=Halosimplex amylolyticum TaxID=3396616 RepID=UPI003F56A1E2
MSSDDRTAGPGGGIYRDERWLRQHVRGLLNFYYPDCIDHRFGGYISQLSDRDGHVYDGESKLVVSTARLVFNFATGKRLGGPDWCHSAAQHGVDFLLDVHRRDDGGYPWLLSGREVEDSERTAYGHAFVLFALSTAAEAEIPRAGEHVRETFETIDEHFWEPEHGLCKGKLDADWEETETYRGQNANMHMCEAFIAAHEATGDEESLDRAYAIAERLALELADDGDGLLWEHYTADWEHDWEYNRDQPTHLFRPWGYQPGHLLEWAKLLCHLDEHVDADWLLPRAERFFDAAVERGWDERGGFVYNFDREGDPIAAEKYYWPLAEGFAAAARLAAATGDDEYWTWYDRIWDYAMDNVVNPKYGNWYFRLTPDNEIDDEALDASPEVKTGYHPLAACADVLRTTNR